MPAGPASVACVAGPSSPTLPQRPLPATVVMMRGLGVDLPDAVVVHVGDVDVAVRCNRDVARHVQVRARRRSAVADVGPSSPGCAVAGDGVDEAGRVIDHPDAVVQRVGDVDVAVRRRRTRRSAC